MAANAAAPQRHEPNHDRNATIFTNAPSYGISDASRPGSISRQRTRPERIYFPKRNGTEIPRSFTTAPGQEWGGSPVAPGEPLHGVHGPLSVKNQVVKYW